MMNMNGYDPLSMQQRMVMMQGNMQQQQHLGEILPNGTSPSGGHHHHYYHNGLWLPLGGGGGGGLQHGSPSSPQRQHQRRSKGEGEGGNGGGGGGGNDDGGEDDDEDGHQQQEGDDQNQNDDDDDDDVAAGFFVRMKHRQEQAAAAARAQGLPAPPTLSDAELRVYAEHQAMMMRQSARMAHQAGYGPPPQGVYGYPMGGFDAQQQQQQQHQQHMMMAMGGSLPTQHHPSMLMSGMMGGPHQHHQHPHHPHQGIPFVGGGSMMGAVEEQPMMTEISFDTLIQDSTLVEDKDRDLVPDALFVAMAQLKPCKLTQADRVGCYKTREIGFVGLCCKHCGGQPGYGRFFPNTVRSLAQTTTSQTILKHIGSKCRFVPTTVRKAVLELQRQQTQKEGTTTGRPRYGSRKIFFQRMWTRLNGKKMGADEEGDENNFHDHDDEEGGTGNEFKTIPERNAEPDEAGEISRDGNDNGSKKRKGEDGDDDVRPSKEVSERVEDSNKRAKTDDEEV